MPRKRAAPAESAASQAKKAKTTTEAASKKAAPEAAEPAATEATLTKVPERWSAVSVSANIAKGHEERLTKSDEAYAFECCCPPRFERPAAFDWEDEDDDDEDEEKDEEDTDQSKCDSGKTCMCRKKAADHPDHPWALSMAGEQLYLSQFVLASLRDPDNFSMYTYNDHFGYGLIEMLQNMILDFMESPNWREQWCIVEAAVMWLLDSEANAMMQVDDSDTVRDSYSMIGRMFLSMIARLDREGVMGEVLNLGTVMALYIKLAQHARDNGLLDEDDAEKVADGIAYTPSRFDDYVLAYSKKHDITLRGPKGLEGFIDECEEVELPLSTSNKCDPWKCAAAVKKYKSEHSSSSAPGSRTTYKGIGGDHYDISSWMPADRKKASFSGKDPFTRSMINSIKEGLVMQLA
ncbi:hypothetical protein LMH87_002495 [Akanthomyces muscarius]|uniref:Uncharacterized protein n=1 Tax=Akanthomyces muscarius TaxID=2231603 RepID=A0A9W8Q9P0_AKAMU|nr:hypothetical protein LMH87_002495 [Akanthomyces muscarius]KAJ4148006.1 hypothetical protein LMH87_002495 [Akanthomyces muscarius]